MPGQTEATEGKPGHGMKCGGHTLLRICLTREKRRYNRTKRDHILEPFWSSKTIVIRSIDYFFEDNRVIAMVSHADGLACCRDYRNPFSNLSSGERLITYYGGPAERVAFAMWPGNQLPCPNRMPSQPQQSLNHSSPIVLYLQHHPRSLPPQ